MIDYENSKTYLLEESENYWLQQMQNFANLNVAEQIICLDSLTVLRFIDDNLASAMSSARLSLELKIANFGRQSEQAIQSYCAMAELQKLSGEINEQSIADFADWSNVAANKASSTDLLSMAQIGSCDAKSAELIFLNEYYARIPEGCSFPIDFIASEQSTASLDRVFAA